MNKLNIIITMAGMGSRFTKAGYLLPKYMINAKNKTLFQYSLESLPCDIANKIIFIALQEHQNNYDLENFIKEEIRNIGIPENKIVIKLIPKVTRGQSETALYAKDLIKIDDEILIYNIDTSFYSKNLKEKLLDKEQKKDGIFGVIKINGIDEKWSFAKVNNDNIIVETAEKRQISNYASTGLYHFTKASDFFKVAEDRINHGLKEANEFYIAPLYNDLIKQDRKFVIDIVDNFIALGTPTEVEEFVNKLK